jgi:hypothetical protein
MAKMDFHAHQTSIHHEPVWPIFLACHPNDQPNTKKNLTPILSISAFSWAQAANHPHAAHHGPTHPQVAVAAPKVNIWLKIGALLVNHHYGPCCLGHFCVYKVSKTRRNRVALQWQESACAP